MTTGTWLSRRHGSAVLGAALAPVLALALAVSGCGPDRQQAAALADQAQQQLDAGDAGAAALSIDKAIREQDDSADLYLLKARIALARNRLAEVFQAYSQAVELEPANVDALRGLAQVSFQLGRADDAERTVDQLLQHSPADPTGRLVKGLIVLSRCRAPAALDLAGQILGNNPADEGGMILKARALFALHRDAEALSVLGEATRRLGNTAGILLTRMEIDRALADGPALRADFVALRRLQPGNIGLALQQINFLYKIGDMAEARGQGAGLLRSGTMQGEDLDRLARLWREYDPAPLSAADLARLSAGGPRPARVVAAQHYLEMGQAGPVSALLAGLDGSDAAGLRARAQLVTGGRAEADAAARAVLAHDKTQCEALLALASVNLAAGRRDEASARAEEAAAECPNQWLAYVVMADANLDSVTELDRVTAAALDADPQNGALARALAARWLSRHEPQRAVAVARRLTRSAPALVSGWTLLAEVCRRSSDSACAVVAARGKHQALKLYAVDPAPGERPLPGGGAIGCRTPGGAGDDQIGRKRSSTTAIQASTATNSATPSATMPLLPS